ncbi:MAG: hypothetical protein M0R68_15845, partial [Bacteroidetes bacterium]|nr:hypothetical protein [Bacteroidota bacterium]
MKTRLFFCICLLGSVVTAQGSHTIVAQQIKNKGLTDLAAFEMLKDLTISVGHRLSGSAGYEKAVVWAKRQLEAAGADSVWLEPVMIPKWVRGEIEQVSAKAGNTTVNLTV